MHDAFRVVVETYERVQVELHGRYSLERLFRLHAYQHTYTTWTCLLVILVTPLPCLVVIVLADLIPLNAPSDGLGTSHVFWVRAFVVVLFITLTLLEQSRRFVPGLPCSTPFLLAMSWLIALGAVVCTVGLSSQVGFPLPFTLIAGTPFWSVFYGAFVVVKWGKLLRQSRALRQQWLSYIKVVIVQMSLTLVYPAFIFVFIRLDGYEQTAFALLLPLIKLVAKNAISATFDQRLEDLKPEGVIFNVEVFHALYMSCCMQSSSSLVTTGLLMLLDFLHAWSSLHDIGHHLRTIQRLEARLASDKGSSGDAGTVSATAVDDSLSLMEKAMFYAHSDESVRRNSAIRTEFAKIQRVQLTAVLPLAPAGEIEVETTGTPAFLREEEEDSTPGATVPVLRELLVASAKTRRRSKPAILFRGLSSHKRRSLESLTEAERILYVSSILQILHIVEFILLIEFVEVIVPVVYCVYLTAMFNLPNRFYYPQLAAMDAHSLLFTIGNVLAYAGLEFVSFVAVCVALRRKLQLSPLHQLAFVLHSQWGLVQSKMVLWVVFAVQVSLAHFGYDYSFEFAWLKAKP